MARIYKETRLDLPPCSPSSVVNIQVPESNVIGSTQRRARFFDPSFAFGPSSAGKDVPVAKDEEEFSRRYATSHGSVYFRKRSVYPRTFLWRVFDENKILEIQCADLVKGGAERFEYNVVLRFEFPEEILPFAVSLADFENRDDELHVFVITASNELYTLTLRLEFFRRSGAIGEKGSEWCKSSVPAPLAFSHPHRLHASSPLELFVSLNSGSLLRLTRRIGDDGRLYTSPTVCGNNC